MTTTPNHTAERDASYAVRRSITIEGDYNAARSITGRPVWLTANRPIGGQARIGEGEIVRLLSTTNAGFNGIECTVELGDRTRRHGISLGAFRVTR